VTVATAEDLTKVDMTDLSRWEVAPPHELFARLRREAPVHWEPMIDWPDEPGIWSITRHADIHAISRDWETWSSERQGFVHVNDIGIPLEMLQQMMIGMDPPRHDRLKALVQRAFTPRRVAEHAEHIRAIVTGVLDRVADRDECDLITDVAAPVPARVIGSMLGTPPEDDAKIVEWTNVLTGFEDPALRTNWEDAMASFAEAWEYIIAMKTAREKDPQDDLFTALAHAEIDGDKLSDAEIVVFFVLLMAAGNDSTRATYSSGMQALMEHPEQLEMLKGGDRGLLAGAVEEIVRCFPAFSIMARTATRDVELHGQTISEGQKVALWYVSGNRDEEVFERPQEFDILRPSLKEHQAFGAGGRHFCLGANLARLELAIWLEETIERFPDMQIAGDPIRVRSVFLNQNRSLPVRLRA
jgi:cytochrome P450